MHRDACLQLIPPASVEGEGTEMAALLSHGFTQGEVMIPGDEWDRGVLPPDELLTATTAPAAPLVQQSRLQRHRTRLKLRYKPKQLPPNARVCVARGQRQLLAATAAARHAVGDRCSSSLEFAPSGR